jgi:competence protein ComEA
MRTGYFYSLIFALFASVSIAAVAAPVTLTESLNSPHSIEVSAVPEHPKLDLNDADAATLQKLLSGVGEAKAKAIVAYRETNGPFASVDELLEVKGIGKAILDRNRDKLEVN